ncbi:cell division protein FtsQ/DivIB [Tritonibacter horizontis]|uniref:Cell division protein FtsQ n=1 Tax=Tritonibacter horizontis TaxID=1768241 RepID=A0A132BZH3_9RHOB|nr:cell division protein FtsQ/DivIB [Tritonibacter horizontis]KUP93773.1 cell division protein FtsQ [Tritonibacter horizontis]
MRALTARRNASARADSRADPAPSRLKYRIQRWMLTPGIRTGLRLGLPICVVLAAAGGYLASETRRAHLVDLYTEARTAFETRPEFMVNVMAIDGAGDSVAADIREVTSLDLPRSSFDLDLAAIRDLIVGLDPVKTAAVRIRPGGILQVDVVERAPAIVWRSRDGLALLDDTGAFVAELGQRSLHPDLPLIAGRGADKKAVEALRLFATARPLGARLRGLIRVGERRWDVVLDRGQRIQLPVERPVAALERVIAMSEVKDLLERDVAVVDLRLPTRLTVRMNAPAVEDWWRIRELNESSF